VGLLRVLLCDYTAAIERVCVLVVLVVLVGGCLSLSARRLVNTNERTNELKRSVSLTVELVGILLGLCVCLCVCVGCLHRQTTL